jgi:hypothetical protein
LVENDDLDFETAYSVKNETVEDLGTTYQINIEDEGALAFWDENYDLGLYKIL